LVGPAGRRRDGNTLPRFRGNKPKGIILNNPSRYKTLRYESAFYFPQIQKDTR